MGHTDFLSIYTAKGLEYGLAIAYLFLFIPFWKYVQGGKRAAVRMEAHAPARAAQAAKPARASRPLPAWFQIPSGVHLHPGHTWARLEADGLVTVGADDFAHKLVGPAGAKLPAPGDHVLQGEPAFELTADGGSVPLLSPIDGTVVAVNSAAKQKSEDPYGAGWLFKVKAPRLAANLRQLLADGPARRFMEEAEAQIAMRLSPEMGQVLQDGGTPIHGIARAMAGDGWDDLARQFFLT
jgi:glycine cleavage system H lipoate-binding protein